MVASTRGAPRTGWLLIALRRILHIDSKVLDEAEAREKVDRIEAYRGTVSLPFEPGEHKRIAVKIVDDRVIESVNVMEVEA
ncbi:MAG: hypothetical protein AMXMBFR4_28690 [Candidatus Hydrogenedentota bacterium]